jgi:hypothetical protein
MIEIGKISEIMDFNSALTWLIAKGKFSTFIHRQSFKSYGMKYNLPTFCFINSAGSGLQ